MRPPARSRTSELYYYETTRIAGDTVLRYELNDRIHPYSMFVTAVDPALVKRTNRRKTIDHGKSVFSLRASPPFGR